MIQFTKIYTERNSKLKSYNKRVAATNLKGNLGFYHKH